MSEDRLRRGLGRLGTLVAADQVDWALERTCIGRIVSLLTLFFIVLCVGLYGLMLYGLYRLGLTERLPESVRTVLGLGLFAGFFVAIILAGLIGDWLRRRIWRLLLRRR